MTITLFVGVPLCGKAEKELAKYFMSEGEEHLKDLIRLGQRFINEKLKLTAVELLVFPSKLSRLRSVPFNPSFSRAIVPFSQSGQSDAAQTPIASIQSLENLSLCSWT